jgi:magnesium transporter
MRRELKSRARKTGLPPGTVVHIGERRVETARVRLMHYDAAGVTERELATTDISEQLRTKSGVTWVHVTGVHDVMLLELLGGAFGLHPLVVEDISNTDQRPKLEGYGDYAYLVLKALQDGAEGREAAIEQVSIVLGADFVLSFEEAEPTRFEAVRARLRDNRGAIRTRGTDYLAYSLLDATVDNYFLVLERYGDRIERLQEELLARAPRRTEAALHGLRRELMTLRRNLWPLREVIGSLARGDSPLWRPETAAYLRDVYDHVIHMVDTIESFREMLANLMDLYLLNATNRLNEVIKVLTLIATVFSPPMLIASVYGMNFRFMPELSWPWGYAFALGLMVATAVAMALFFRRKKWI